MKRTLGLTLLFVCLGLFAGPELRADSVTTYNFSATLVSPAGFVSDQVSGTFTLDTTIGNCLRVSGNPNGCAWANLTGATPDPLTIGYVYSWHGQSLYPNLVELQFYSTNYFEGIALYYATSWDAFDPSTLTYVETGQGQTGISTLGQGYVWSGLTNASTTVATPEPSSLYLLLSGIVGIFLISKMVR